MDQSPNLRLPYLMPAQAQKHVTHNEALRALDAIVQVGVLDRDLATPPASPADGDRYIVAASPTGAWAGAAGKIAAWQDGVWEIYQPKAGWLAWVADEAKLLAWNGTAWVIAGGSSSVNPVSMVGVNTTADTTNRLAVKSDAALFSHDDVTPGTGDHRTILNKSAAAKTASFLFQDGFSGRAEVGLTGDDDLHVKVSADGAAWKDALKVDRSTGVVDTPFTPKRERLTANRTYYVRTDGNDANNGLANTAGGAFATLAKLASVLDAIDGAGFDVTLQLGNTGTFSGGLTLSRPLVGIGTLTIVGNAASAGSYTISASGNCIAVSNGARVNLSGVTLTSSAANCLSASGVGSRTNVTGAVVFGSAAASHMTADRGGLIEVTAAYSITGGAQYHMNAGIGPSLINMVALTVTLTGTPAFSQNFVLCTNLSLVRAVFMTYSGAATGSRYIVTTGGIIDTFGGGASYFPGSTAGTAVSPGAYL